MDRRTAARRQRLSWTTAKTSVSMSWQGSDSAVTPISVLGGGRIFHCFGIAFAGSYTVARYFFTSTVKRRTKRRRPMSRLPRSGSPRFSAYGRGIGRPIVVFAAVAPRRIVERSVDCAGDEHKLHRPGDDGDLRISRMLVQVRRVHPPEAELRRRAPHDGQRGAGDRRKRAFQA
jgi:hypothetical protein